MVFGDVKHQSCTLLHLQERKESGGSTCLAFKRHYQQIGCHSQLICINQLMVWTEIIPKKNSEELDLVSKT